VGRVGYTREETTKGDTSKLTLRGGYAGRRNSLRGYGRMRPTEQAPESTPTSSGEGQGLWLSQSVSISR
jgi:hypothetical protein